MSPLRTYAPLGLGLGVVLLLAGCGGGTTPQAAAATPAPAATGAPRPAATPGAGGGVSGTIAYVSGQLMQVQDTSMQTAVGWTASTTIDKETAGTLADVTAGSCVVATSFTPGTAGAGASAAPTAAPTADPNAPVTRVVVTQPVDGTCRAGGAFGGGARTPGQAPSGAASQPRTRPSGAPTGGFAGGARAFGFHTGLVTGVSGDTVSIQTTGQGGATTTATFTVGASTTYTTTVKADASAIVVGQCAAAFGPADSSGTVAATSITVSAPTNGQCSSFSATRAGFAGRGGFRAGAGAGTTQGGSNA